MAPKKTKPRPMSALERKLIRMADRLNNLQWKIWKVRTWSSRIKKSGVSQNEIARRAKVETASMSRFINEQIEPSDSSMLKIEAAMKKLGV